MQPPRLLSTSITMAISICCSLVTDLLLRNNGDGTFCDQTAAAKLSDKVSHTRSCPPTSTTGATSICSSLRLKKSRSGATCATERFATSRRKSALTSQRRNECRRRRRKQGRLHRFLLCFARDTLAISRSATAKSVFKSTRTDGGSNASQFIDYDNDGLLDLVSVVQGNFACCAIQATRGST